jgi:hypothetical protein
LIRPGTMLMESIMVLTSDRSARGMSNSRGVTRVRSGFSFANSSILIRKTKHQSAKTLILNGQNATKSANSLIVIGQTKHLSANFSILIGQTDLYSVRWNVQNIAYRNGMNRADKMPDSTPRKIIPVLQNCFLSECFVTSQPSEQSPPKTTLKMNIGCSIMRHHAIQNINYVNKPYSTSNTFIILLSLN